MVLIAADESLNVPKKVCEKCGTESNKCVSSVTKNQQTLILCFCNSLVRKRRQSKRRNTSAEIFNQHQQEKFLVRPSSLPSRINIMGGIESKSVTGNRTPTSHRKLLVDPRSPTTGIDRTPIAVEKSMGETLRVCETDLNVTPTDEHFLEDPRSPNCPRTPIPLNDPRSPCGAVTRTPIFVKHPTGQESDDKADPEKFVFTIKQTPSPPKIVTTECTSEMEQFTGQAVSMSKATVHSKIEDVNECLKQISTPEYDEELTTLVRSNMKNDVIYRDEHTHTKELPKKPKSNRPSLKKIQKKKIQEMSQGQQRSPLATRNHHSDSPVVSSKTRTYIRLDRNASDFRKRQNSLGSTGTRLSAKFEIFTEKENV